MKKFVMCGLVVSMVIGSLLNVFADEIPGTDNYKAQIEALKLETEKEQKQAQKKIEKQN